MWGCSSSCCLIVQKPNWMTDELKEIVVKYITGNASAEEAVQVKRWILECEANEKEYVLLYESWHHALEHDGMPLDTEQAWQKQKQIIQKSPKPVVRRMWSGVLRIAAISLMICTIGYYFFNAYSFHKNEHHAAKGQKLKVVLDDGTIIWLNGGSSLKYNAGFARDNRTVMLDGEALFDIKPSAAGLPFIVQTDKFIVRDIGTVFSIKSYANDEHFEAAVVQGEISIEPKAGHQNTLKDKVHLLHQQAVKIPTNSSERLLPAHMSEKNDASLAAPLKVITVTPVQMQAYNGWKDGVLMFESERFEEIAHTLENVYNVNIKIEDEALKNYIYSGTFRDKKTIQAILDIIKKTTPLKYTIKDQAITITTL